MYRNGVQAYKQANVTTADPTRLVLMCYDGAIGSLKTAREHCVSGDYEAKARSLKKTQDILNVLMQGIDFEQGGTMALNLDSLYNYMLRRLLPCPTAEEEMAAIDEVLGMLEELESAWKEILAPSRQTHDGDMNVVTRIEEDREKPAPAPVTYYHAVQSL